MGRPLDVVVVGNVGVDTNVYLYGREIDFTVEGNFTENLDTVGQAGGYTSRGFARLGKRTAFIGYVGDDALGRDVRETLARDGVDTRALFVDPAGTSRSVNLMSPDGRRRNFYDGKSHMTLEPDLDVCRAVLAEARLAHFHLPNWARRLLPIARELGLTIACDLQDVVDPNDPYRQDFLAYADVLFFSAANLGDPTPLVQRFLAARPDRVVVTGMGREGCAVGTAAGVERFAAVSHERPVVDTNGAGDGLAVGFLATHVLEGAPVRDAVRYGQLAARHTCTLRGTSEGLLTRAELEERFLRG